jgi:FAD/FMN-containing dehydrogenase
VAGIAGELRESAFSARRNPVLFQPLTNRRVALPALQVSLGRLGILTSVTFSIVPQRAVQRLLQTTSTANFTSQVMAVQEAYKAALNNGSTDALGAALSKIDETQVPGDAVIMTAPRQVPQTCASPDVPVPAKFDIVG